MKISQYTRPVRGAVALSAGLLAVPAVLGASHPTVPASGPTRAAAPREPQLSVAVTDGRAAARAGDVLTYAVTVRDTGPAAAPRLAVTETLSPGLAFVSASSHGRASAGHVSWAASLPAGGTRTFRVVTRVVETPPALLRLSAVACVALPGSRRPAVCAAHLDRLPAAAAAQATPAGRGTAVYAAVAGVGALTLGLVAALAARRRGGLLRRRAA
jgi:uncharacterized repeat protein (TIGR01451 family)